MKVEALKNERVSDFAEYCKLHREEIDHSFLYDEDLNEFKPNGENPTYVISNQKGQLIAAASLIMDDYHRRGKRGRFRIFHSSDNNLDCYRMLLRSLLKHTRGLDKVFLFIPKENHKLIEIMGKLNFSIERHSYFLFRENVDIPEYQLEQDCNIRAFTPGKDESVWCEVRNAAFAKLQGSETPVTTQMVSEMVSRADYIDGGMMILFHNQKAVGVVKCETDGYGNEPSLHINTLAILPEYQGKGFGRILLRAALRFGKENSFKRTTLSVNRENDRAIALYIQEGFIVDEAYTCLNYATI